MTEPLILFMLILFLYLSHFVIPTTVQESLILKDKS